MPETLKANYDITTEVDTMYGFVDLDRAGL